MSNTLKNFFRQFTLFKIEDFHKYIDLMEQLITEQKDNYSDFIDEQTKNLTPDERDEVIEIHFLDDYQTLSNTFPQILRKSTFITLYSLLETELYKIAINLERKNPEAENIKEFKNRSKHNGVFLYYSYIKHQTDTLIISNELELKFKHYNTLRNYFVHDDFNDLSIQDIKSLTKNLKTENDFVDSNLIIIKEINEELNYEFLNDLIQFFELIYKQVNL